MPRLTLKGVSRTYPGTSSVEALKSVSLSIEQGDFVVIEGPSGGGKSTLLNVIGLLDAPSQGTFAIDDVDANRLDARAVSEIRSDFFAFIFQSFHLLDRRVVSDSVELSLMYRAVSRRERRSLALAALSRVGLGEFATTPANKLSGGERQRVAIARALASNAPVIIADEPTGNLDSENSRAVINALRGLNDDGATVVLVTHSRDIAIDGDMRVNLLDGSIVGTAEPRARRYPPIASSVIPSAGVERPGSASRLRTSDLFFDAWAGIRSRPARTSGLVAAVSVAVALTMSTLGLSYSAQAQVSDTFDAYTNREVTAQWGPEQLKNQDAEQRDSLNDRLSQLNGVDSSVVLTGYESHDVRLAPSRPTYQVPVFSANGELESAARMQIDWQKGAEEGDPGLLVGANLALQLDLGPLDGSPLLTVDGHVFPVIGIIETSSRAPDLLGSILVDGVGAGEFSVKSGVQAFILTKPGAAQQVAREAPIVIDPVAPTGISIAAPTDPSDLRQDIEGGVQATLIALTGIALLAAIAGLTNATILTVLERKQELGLRRAVGARPEHIAALIATESAMVGVLGGIVGLITGVLAILAITVVQNWTPVFDFRLAPVAIVGGMFIGILGGIAASVRASLVQPSEALRL